MAINRIKLVLSCKPLEYQSCVVWVKCIYMSGVERGVVGWLACMSIKLLVGEGHVCKSSLMQERNQTTKQQYIAPHTLLCVYTQVCVCVCSVYCIMVMFTV